MATTSDRQSSLKAKSTMARAPSVANPLPCADSCETPADLDCGLREVGDDVAHDLQADGSREVAGVADDRGEEAEAGAVEGGEVAIKGLVALLARERALEVVHDDGVGVHSGEGLAVALLPAAEEEAWGFELERFGQELFLEFDRNASCVPATGGEVRVGSRRSGAGCWRVATHRLGCRFWGLRRGGVRRASLCAAGRRRGCRW